MHKILIAVMATLALAGCTAREQQILAAGTVGAVAGAVIGSELGRNMDQNQGHTQPQQRVIVHERPVYIERPRPPRCEFIRQWDHRYGGYRDVRVCERY